MNGVNIERRKAAMRYVIKTVLSPLAGGMVIASIAPSFDVAVAAAAVVGLLWGISIYL